MSKKVSTSAKKGSGTIVNEETTTPSTIGSELPSTWVSKPDEIVPIDDAFWVKKQRWGTYVSIARDGSALLTTLDEDQCISATRWYLKAKQDGFSNEDKRYDGEVGGKL